MASVLVFGETAAGRLAAVSRELLGAAARLNQGLDGDGVACALLGHDLNAAAQQAVAAGAATVSLADDPGLAQYQTETFLPIAADLVRESGARVVLLGQTSTGRDLAPRLATRLNSAVAMDALELAIAGDRVQVTRACYGGNVRQVVTVRTEPQVITVRAKSQDPLPDDPGRSGEIRTVAVALAEPAARLIGKETAAAQGVRLEDADVVIAGGRGLGSAEAFGDVERLAALLGGAVGASRAACDLGWYPPSQQVGLTGSVVSPTLYLAIAISGASQHLAGCGGSKNIVAINKDADANIFGYCRFGVVDDYKKVLPAFEAELQKILAEG